jgi:excisionase family DNA binding protein
MLLPVDGSLLTEKEAAHHLNLSHRTLQRWRWSGRGPRFIKVGAAVRYERHELDRFVDDSRRSSTSDRRTS